MPGYMDTEAIKFISGIYEKCRRPGSNRHGYYYPRDFKSRASANSATAANVVRSVTRTLAI